MHRLLAVFGLALALRVPTRDRCEGGWRYIDVTGKPRWRIERIRPA